ncbi:MAG: glycoside hydrolase family 78 protein [Lachnospiraceae bacterium]|nr:glycoside hydrolase family 78 protein [Lachnospiraceae bacterium]
MLNAVNLKTEYLKNPLGIDICHPRLGWNLTGDGEEQRAFEIRAAHSEEDLKKHRFVWESGVVKSSSMFHHAYEPELKSGERIYWQVRIHDESDVLGEWSETAWFEMGLLTGSDWKAKWISGDYGAEKGTKYPADYFRKCFYAKRIVKARMYMTACGVYETELNGKKVGNIVLAPGLTSYDQRIQYQVYDVTGLLQNGENEWKITLGDGWFRGNLGCFDTTHVFGDRTAVLGQLELTDAEGNTEYIITDGTFSWSNDGPIYYTDIKGGERIDASLTPTYGKHAVVVGWDAKLCCSNNVPVTEHERFQPMVLHTPDGSTVLDFGQNISGYVEFTVEGAKGREMILTMGEMLDSKGNFTLDNLLQRVTFQEDNRDFDKFQKIVYRCAGTGRESWKPKFCFQGFQYVKLENFPTEVKPEDFTAIAVYSDMEPGIQFCSSSKDLNKIVENTFWSMKGNFLDIPTDCPTRERAGWTGDAQLFFNAGSYFMDFSAFFRKWIQDLYDDQAEDGKIHNIVPRTEPHGGTNDFVEGSCGWTDAGILIPYRYWKRYFDKEILKKHYGSMKKLLEYLLSRRGVETDPELDTKLAPSPNRKYLVTSGFHFGEWNEPDKDISMIGMGNFEEATAYLVYSLRHMAEIAELLGEKEDAELFTQYANESEAAYMEYFVPGKKIESKRMCKYVRPLALGLLDKDLEAKKNVQEGLITLVREKGHHVGTGFLSTPFVLEVLSEAGYAEDAYQMLLKEEYPSWVYEIRRGASTVWEDWDGTSSRNHYSNGAICDWIFGGICGIHLVGENEFEIRPVPGSLLDYADCTWKSPFGRVYSSWTRQENTFAYHIELPVGCHGTVILPDGTKKAVRGGRKYHF